MESRNFESVLASLKQGSSNNGERDITPEMGRLGFYCNKAKVRRLPKPCENM